MLHAVDLAAPALEGGEKVGERLARLAGKLLGLHDLARRLVERDAAARPRQLGDAPYRRIAKSALGHIDDALELEVVGGIERHLQVGDGVLDLLALVEAGAADDAVGQPQRDEAVFEGAHLERGPHQDRHLVEACAGLAQGLDVLADGARLLLVVPHACNRYRLAHGTVGEQRLAEAALVVGDETRRRRQDVSGRAVVALQPDHGGAGEVRLEAQDVVDLGAAPAVDRLVVVADAADVGPGGAAGQQAQPQVLGDVGVLVFVDQHVAEPGLVVREHLRVVAEQPQHLQQQVAEVCRVELLQALLVGGVEGCALALGKGEGLPARHLIGRQPSILPAVDQGCQLAARPAVLVEALALDHLLDEAHLVVGVEDGEARLEAHQLGVPAQDLDADGMEGSEPRHALHGAADQLADAILHLARGLVGESDGQDLRAARPTRAQDVRDAGGENPRLTRASSRKHQHGPVERRYGCGLLGIEIGHVGGSGQPKCPRRHGGLRRVARCHGELGCPSTRGHHLPL